MVYSKKGVKNGKEIDKYFNNYRYMRNANN